MKCKFIIQLAACLVVVVIENEIKTSKRKKTNKQILIQPEKVKVFMLVNYFFD